MRREVWASFLLILIAFVDIISCIDPAGKDLRQTIPDTVRQNNNEDPALNPAMTWDELVKMSKKINQQQQLDEEYDRVMKQAEAEFNADQAKIKHEGPRSNIKQKEQNVQENLANKEAKKSEPIANMPKAVEETQKKSFNLQQPKSQIPTSKQNNAIPANPALVKKEPEIQQPIALPPTSPTQSINNQFKKAEQQRKKDMEMAANLKAIKQRELQLEKIKKRNEKLLRQAEEREDAVRVKTEQDRKQKIQQLEAQKAKLVEEQRQQQAKERARISQRAALAEKMRQQDIRKQNQQLKMQAEQDKQNLRIAEEGQKQKIKEEQLRNQKKIQDKQKEVIREHEIQQQQRKMRQQSQRREDLKYQQEKPQGQMKPTQPTQPARPAQPAKQAPQAQQVQQTRQVQQTQQVRQAQQTQHVQNQQQTHKIEPSLHHNNPIQTTVPVVRQTNKPVKEAPARKLSPEERRRAEEERKKKQEQIYGQLEEQYIARRAKFMEQQKQKKLQQMKKQKEQQEKRLQQQQLAMTKEEKQQLQRKFQDQARLEKLMKQQIQMATLIQKNKAERAQKEKDLKLNNLPIPPEKPFWDQKEPPVHMLFRQVSQYEENMKDSSKVDKKSEQLQYKWQEPEDATEDYNLKTILKKKKKGKQVKPNLPQKKIAITSNPRQQSSSISEKSQPTPKQQKLQIAKSILEYAEQIDNKETRRKIILQETEKIDDSENISFTKSEVFFLSFSLILGIAMFFMIKNPPDFHQNFDGPNFQGGMLISTQDMQ